MNKNSSIFQLIFFKTFKGQSQDRRRDSDDRRPKSDTVASDGVEYRCRQSYNTFMNNFKNVAKVVSRY